MINAGSGLVGERKSNGAELTESNVILDIFGFVERCGIVPRGILQLSLYDSVSLQPVSLSVGILLSRLMV